MKHYKTFKEAQVEKKPNQIVMYHKDKGFYLHNEIESLEELERIRQSELLNRMRESGL